MFRADYLMALAAKIAPKNDEITLNILLHSHWTHAMLLGSKNTAQRC